MIFEILWGFLSFVGNMILWVGKITCCGIGSLLTLLWLFQDQLVYLPAAHTPDKRKRQVTHNNPRLQTPTKFNPAIHYEDAWIRCSDDVYIHSWLLLQPSPLRSKVPTLIYFHGNAGNIGFRLLNASDFYTQLQCNILMVEYRGYGNSEGGPSEAGLKLDAEASLDFLLKHKEINKNKIVIFGRSLGGAVALSMVGLQDKISGFIVENTFTCIYDMVVVIAERIGIPFSMDLGRPLKWFLRSPWESVR